MFGCRMEKFGSGIQLRRGLSHNENLISGPLAMLCTEEKTSVNIFLGYALCCFFLIREMSTPTNFSYFCFNSNVPLIKNIICKVFCVIIFVANAFKILYKLEITSVTDFSEIVYRILYYYYQKQTKMLSDNLNLNQIM